MRFVLTEYEGEAGRRLSVIGRLAFIVRRLDFYRTCNVCQRKTKSIKSAFQGKPFNNNNNPTVSACLLQRARVQNWLPLPGC